MVDGSPLVFLRIIEDSMTNKIQVTNRIQNGNVIQSIVQCSYWNQLLTTTVINAIPNALDNLCHTMFLWLSSSLSR